MTREEIEALALLRAAEAYGIEWTPETEQRLRKSLVFAGACMRLHGEQLSKTMTEAVGRALYAIESALQRRDKP